MTSRTERLLQRGEWNAIRIRGFGDSELTFVDVVNIDSGTSHEPVSG
jgi:hypothetical protein